MALFSSHSKKHDLYHDLEALRRDVAALSRTVSKQGATAWRGAAGEASGLYDDLAGRIGHALPVMRRRAHDLEETIRDNPGRAVAVAGLATLALVAAACIMGSARR